MRLLLVMLFAAGLASDAQAVCGIFDGSGWRHLKTRKCIGKTEVDARCGVPATTRCVCDGLPCLMNQAQALETPPQTMKLRALK